MKEVKNLDLPARPAVKALGGQEIESDSNNPLNAAVGIKNGLIFGGALWALSYLVFTLVSYFS